MKALSIERILVGEKDLEALVRVRAPEFMRTSTVPGLSTHALQLLPGLARHRCDNDRNARFVDESRDTETPHLLEHLTVELMALAGSPRSVSGRTSWDFEADGRGVFHVSITFDDDLVALGALKEADLVVDWLFGLAEKPDLDATVAALAELRRR